MLGRTRKPTRSPSLLLGIVAAGGAVAGVAGCVDARGRYDEFAERVVDADTRDIDGALVSTLPDVDGEWYLAIRPDLQEDRIIRFRLTVDLTPITENTGTIDITGQPLAVADASDVGDPLVATDAPVSSDATFDLPLTGLLPAAANPVSGTDANIDAMMQGQLVDADHMCGTLTGTAGALPLEGTTWAAIRVAGADVTMLPNSCAALMPMP
jgi:hypothetical protein